MFFPRDFAFAVGNWRYTIPMKKGTTEVTTSISSEVILLGRRRYRKNVEVNDAIKPMMMFIRTME